jgi:hypothetical protein
MTNFAASEVNEDIVGKDDCDISLGSGLSLVYSSCLLHIDGPRGGLPVLGDLQLKDAVGLRKSQRLSLRLERPMGK